MNNILKRNLFLQVGCISAVSLCSFLAIPAQAQTFQEIGGRESIRFVPETLEALQSAGLTLLPLVSTTTPAEGFDFAFQLIPPTAESIRRTNLAFELSEVDGVLQTIPLGGQESFDGKLTFGVDTTKLSLEPQLEFANFSTFFPPDFFSPDFQIFVAEEDARRLPEFRLFDISILGPITVDLSNQTLVLENVSLNIAQEFSDFLLENGAEAPTVGLTLIEARGDRVIEEISTASVPEPSSSPLVWTLAGAVVAVARKYLAA
jgi:hypothetical protein